jgi:hypothetical protein
MTIVKSYIIESIEAGKSGGFVACVEKDGKYFDVQYSSITEKFYCSKAIPKYLEKALIEMATKKGYEITFTV